MANFLKMHEGVKFAYLFMAPIINRNFACAHGTQIDVKKYSKVFLVPNPFLESFLSYPFSNYEKKTYKILFIR